MRIERVATHADPRGYVFEPLSETEIAAQRNVHVVISQPGAVRGNHVHARRTEILAISGPALLRYRENGVVRDVRVGDGEVVRCLLPPGVAHAVQNTGDKPQLLVSFNDLPHDPAAPDVTAVPLLP